MQNVIQVLNFEEILVRTYISNIKMEPNCASHGMAGAPPSSPLPWFDGKLNFWYLGN